MPWSPQPQIMARTKASHIRLPAEPAEHRVVAGTLTNRRRMGQEARRLERTFGPSRFNHLRRPATPPPEWHIDGEGTPPPVRYGRPRRAKRAPAPAPAPVPTGDSGHLVLPCVEINQYVGLSWLRRAVRNRHRLAIEQASHRWRGGRREDSAQTRRKILFPHRSSPTTASGRRRTRSERRRRPGAGRGPGRTSSSRSRSSATTAAPCATSSRN